MPNSPVRILIVEDAEVLPELMEKLVKPLREMLPSCEITSTPSLARALEMISEYPPPDVITLDLTLSDSDRENTMRHVERIESRSPVVLITGGSVEKWKDMLDRLQIEVIDKSSNWLAGGFLALAIARALVRGNKREAERVEKRLVMMQATHEQLKAKFPDAGP